MCVCVWGGGVHRYIYASEGQCGDDDKKEQTKTTQELVPGGCAALVSRAQWVLAAKEAGVEQSEKWTLVENVEVKAVGECWGVGRNTIPWTTSHACAHPFATHRKEQ
jgi:hypothetical protein